MNKEKTKAWRILEFIGSKGNEGASLTEIQFFIWTVLDGNSEESFWKKGEVWKWTGHESEYGRSFRESKARQTRGHWCTALYGGPFYHTGLLHEYCIKEKEKWVLDKMPVAHKPIYRYKSNIFSFL